MRIALPTVKDLEKLPLRAVVAYAARTARRLSSELRGIIADEILDNALRTIEAVSTTDLIAAIDNASVIVAAQRVAAAYADAPATMKSLERFRIVFSLIHAAEVAMFVLLAVSNPRSAGHQMKRAAKEAHRTVAPIAVLSSKVGGLFADAARHDYDILLSQYARTREGHHR
jgi:hypothetical protein